MAESIILALATSILNTVASFTGELLTENIIEEIKGFKSFKENLKFIAEDLESITSVLHDAEAKQYNNAAMKIWLRDLKSVVYDIDDLLDEVVTHVKERSLNKGHILTQLGYYLSLKPIILRLDFSHKLKELRLQLGRIVVKRTNFGLTDRPIEAPSVERDVLDSCGYVNKLAILGRDEAKKDITRRVLGVAGECSLSVIPILGMGGIGKTALAKIVFSEVDEFDMKLWVCVSDKFDIQKILQDILKGATHETTSSNHSIGELVDRTRDVLNGKRFFLVLDDLWEDDIRLWIELKSIIDVGCKGSVILITTRMENVAHNTKTLEPYNLDKLPDLVCWCIFKTLAFGDGEEERYPRLCEIGLSIVKKCCGIPLVVQCLACLLRNEKDEVEWLRIKNTDNFYELDKQYDKVKQLLKLSYDKLPFHLKPCFSPLSLFGKDFVYAPFYHSYCCSALGLLQLRDGSYFTDAFCKELLSRSLVQDVEWVFNIIVVGFKMHDLMHDLAGDVLGEELIVITRNKLSASDSTRYISWGLNDLTDMEFPGEIRAKKARAFIFRFQMRNVSECFLNGVMSNMPRLRILGLGSSQFEKLPTTIANLKHLRFLDLSYNGLIKTLPDSICELLNLECLHLAGCEQLEELPSEMNKLISLRFLSLTTCQRSLAGTKFESLPSLRHLWLCSCETLESLWDNEDVGRLTSLLGLEIDDCPNLTGLPNSMKRIIGLQELWIRNCNGLDLERGEALSGLHSLKTLSIKGVPKLSCLPNGVQSAANTLKHLWIEDCVSLVELPKWLHSCVSLEKLALVNCRRLVFLPQGIRDLKSLHYLKIENCWFISLKCAVPDGEYMSLIRHVPEIWIDGHRLNPRTMSRVLMRHEYWWS